MDFSGINVNSAAFFVIGDADARDVRTILLLILVVGFVLAIVRPEVGIVAPVLPLTFGLFWIVIDPSFICLALSRVRSQPLQKNRSYIVL